MSKVITVKDFNSTTFYQLPKAFFYNEKYTGMKNESKIAYAILRNLLTLSIEKEWINEKGEIYVKLSREKLMKYLNIKGTQKMTQVMKELYEKELIVERKLGLNRCNEIYLCNPDELKVAYQDSELLDETEEEVAKEEESRTFENQNSEDLDILRTFENQNSEPLKIKTQEQRKSKVQTFENQRHIKNSKVINTNYNKNDINIEKKRKEHYDSSLPIIPMEIGMSRQCFNFLTKDIDFIGIDFNESEYYMALLESIAIAQEKDDVDFITMKQYGYLKQTLKNKLDMIV